MTRPVSGQNGATQLTSRAGNDITAAYPELWPLWERMLARNAVIDGELVALGDDGRPSFQRLQRRMHVREAASVERLRRQIPVTYMVFDLLAIDGEAFIDYPLTERQAALDDLLVPGGAWERSRPIVGQGVALYEAAVRQGLEGILAKRADSVYVPGRRTRDWRKIKVRRSANVVIGGWAPATGTLDGLLGSLCAGAWDNDELVFVGRVGTGFGEHERRRLAEVLAPLAAAASPFDRGDDPGPDARYVNPQLVCEVEFSEFTEGGRLRAPSYKRLLPQADPTSVSLAALR